MEDTLTELNASDGSLLRTLSGGPYGFDGIAGLAFAGPHLWAANAAGNSLIELNAGDGSLVRILSGGSYGFNYPNAFAFDGPICG